jgi:hypothetical protein
MQLVTKAEIKKCMHTPNGPHMSARFAPPPPRLLAPAKLAAQLGGQLLGGGANWPAHEGGGAITTAGQNRTRPSPKSAATPGPKSYILTYDLGEP